MKKILMILDNGFKPDLRVKKEIDTLVKLGYSIVLYCWDQEGNLPSTESSWNFTIHRIRLVVKQQQGIKKIVDLLKFYYKVFDKITISEDRYNYIYVHDFLLLLLGVLLKIKLKIPLIYDAHEIYHLMEWEKYNAAIRNMIFLSERFLSKFANAFIVVNQKRKDFYSKYLKKEFYIIGNWYDTYDGEIVKLKEEHNIPENQIVLSYFGVINFDERPINKLIEIIINLPNIHFFVAGVGKDENEILRYEEKFSRVHYLGWQKNIRKYLADVDFIIYYMNDQRKYFEYTAPNTLYLAISHCVPIITNVPGEAKDLIKNNNIGYFINNPKEMENKIQFDTNSEEYLEKIKSITQIQSKFNWSNCEKTYNEIFYRLDKNHS